jgi:hypothetical protein
MRCSRCGEKMEKLFEWAGWFDCGDDLGTNEFEFEVDPFFDEEEAFSKLKPTGKILFSCPKCKKSTIIDSNNNNDAE